jgi:vitamin B12 transporter
MKKKMFFVAAVFISGHLIAQDTTGTKSLDEVIVTANKISQKQSTTGKVVAVIDQATLQRNAGKTIAEIINYQAGVFINGANNGLGTNQDVYMRGSNSGNTLILIDGIPVGDASQINNSFDLNNIAIGQVERIEILKGAQSTLWGSDAVAGVINIITKKDGAKKIGATGLLSYGSYNTLRGNAGINGAVDKFTYNVNYNFTNSKGFSSAYDSTGAKNFDKDGFTQNNFQANIGYKFNTRFGVTAFSNFGKYKADLDAGAFKDDADYSFTNKSSNNAAAFNYTATKVNLHLSQNIITAKRLYIDDSASRGGFAKYSKGSYKGNTSVTELYGSYQFAKQFSLVSGLQHISQKTEQDYLSISSFGPYKTALGDSAKARNFSFYASVLGMQLNGFNIEGGFRYNHHNIYGSNATYTFNPSYNIDENTKVFVNISSGYKIPSLYQLYSEYGNKQLKPEESNNYEIGVQTFSNNKSSSFRITAFKRDIKNVIIFYSDPVTYASQYINRDKQNDYGFELESTIAVGKKGSWVNNMTYVEGDGTDNNVKVKNLYRRPNFTLNSVLTLQPTKGFTIMPSFRFVGTRLKGQYDAGPAQMPQYYTIDCYAGYEFKNKLRVFIDYRNITNQQYFDVPGYNSRRSNFMTGINFNF